MYKTKADLPAHIARRLDDAEVKTFIEAANAAIDDGLTVAEAHAAAWDALADDEPGEEVPPADVGADNDADPKAADLPAEWDAKLKTLETRLAGRVDEIAKRLKELEAGPQQEQAEPLEVVSPPPPMPAEQPQQRSRGRVRKLQFGKRSG